MSVRPGIKKRRAPLPEEVFANLASESGSTDVQDGSRVEYASTSTERLRILPPCKPSQDKSPKYTRRHSLTPDGTPKITLKSLDDINVVSDNEALDVHRSSENLKALNVPRHGRKRHSSGDIPKILRRFASGSSLQSLNLSQRSVSLNSITSVLSTEYVECQMVDQEDIITLTVRVRNFSDALSKLRNAFSGSGSDTDSDEFTDNGSATEDIHVNALELLGKVLSNLKEVINQYPSLQSNEILAAAGYLISKIKGHNYEENKMPDDFYQSIDQLALVFSSSISDFLMGDQEVSPKTIDDTVDCGEEFAEDGDEEDLSEGDLLHDSPKLPSEQDLRGNDFQLPGVETDLAQVLLGMESGVEFCLRWTKCWSKYVKDIANYIEKRAQLALLASLGSEDAFELQAHKREAEYTKQLAKLAQATRTSICEENYLPFQSTFFTALDQDVEYSQRCQRTLTAITGSKFMEPLMQRRTVHDHARKDMKDDWTKMCKQLHDSQSSLKTSKNIYHKRKQELEKLNTKQNEVKESREDSQSSVISVFGTSKGKKEEELKVKVDEAEQFYNDAVGDVNKKQSKAEKEKERIVTQTKQLVNECDRTFRSVTRKYFDMMHDLAVPTPIHFKTLSESCQGYEPGKQFEEFVRFQQSSAQSASHPVYEFEQYSKRSRFNPELIVDDADGASTAMKAWPSESQIKYYEYGTSPAPSPSSSPQAEKKTPTNKHTLAPTSTDDEAEVERKLMPKPGRTFAKNRSQRRPKPSLKVPLSKNTLNHTFHKIRSPAKCSECDSYMLALNGFECSKCGLSCHKKCRENLNTPCSHSRRRTSPLKRMKTFGVGFSEDGGVPILVTKCVKELNRRGLRVKGIYRVSGVKSKMEWLCQEFETNADSVDISTQPPHLIASVLKLYIRQLPEPLMTTKIYPELIQLAKESSNVRWLTYDEYEDDKDKQDFEKLLEKLKTILNKLPHSNYLTTATLIKHLHKVANNEKYNQMNSQNLAIVFGPTILRLESENSTSSLSSFFDMPHQTRIVALLIVNPQLFDKAGDDSDVEGATTTDLECAKNENTLVEEFVSPKPEDETTMPDLYGVRSNRVRGEGLSPMDKLQSSDGQENKRVDNDTSRINEHIDVKDETAVMFDDNEISLPGSLERRNKFLDWVPDDEDLSEREVDIGRLRINSDKQTEMNITGDFTKEGSPSRTGNGTMNGFESSRFSRRESFDKENLDSSKSSVDFAEMQQGYDEKSSSIVPPNEQDDDAIRPRRRSKAFSAGHRNDPEMLAKRGSALMNAFIDSNHKTEDVKTSPGGFPTNGSTSYVHVPFNDANGDVKHSDQEHDETTEAVINDTGNLTSVTSAFTIVKSEAGGPDSKTTMANEVSNMFREKAATSSGNVSPESSGDETSCVKSGARAPRRKRSATYDGDKRRAFKNQLEKDDRHFTGDRVFDFSMRTRRHRVSVKDQIKQLEQKENKSDSLRLCASSPRPRAHTGDRLNDESANSSSENVDGKINLDDDIQDGMPPAKDVRAHEPLSRVSLTGRHVDPAEMKGALLLNTPRSSITSQSADEEATFRALKMDISLESPRTPSSVESSDEDSTFSKEVIDREHRLNPWSGQGLTPRNSNQAPEFV